MVSALVAGSGPNGLAAAVRLAQAGIHVTVREAAAGIGGATRSGPLTLPGFVHDLGSAVHPMAVSSPFFSSLPLKEYGLQWIWPDAQLAHPFADGSAILIERDVTATANQFGTDAETYRNLFQPMVENWRALVSELLTPIGFPRHPLLLAPFGVKALQPAAFFAKHRFANERTRALFAGMAAHSTLPLESPLSGAFGLMLGASAHAAGWPIARGGSQSIADALAGYFTSLGGLIITQSRVDALGEEELTLCDLTPRQFLELEGLTLPDSYRRLLRNYRYGPGVFKLDWALSQPIPWRAPECSRAATVHLGASFSEICSSERAANSGRLSARPFLILAQPTLFDPTRAPGGKHVAWAYCHVPHSFAGSALEQVENQVERFAPGFRDCILARCAHSALDMQAWNENLVGGDINGGTPDWRQFVSRPTFRRYRTPHPGVFLCSASTPPGAAVHGMCGFWAAEAALRYLKFT